MLPRVVASDLDGTLLCSDGVVGPRTRRALAACEAAGALVVLCTARPARWVRPIAAQLGLRTVAICANGAVTWDFGRDLVLAEAAIEPEAAATVVDALERLFPGGAWAVERSACFAREPAYTPRWPAPPDTVVAHVRSLIAERAIKLMFDHDRCAPEEMFAAAREAVAGLAELTYSTVGRRPFEISASGVTKGSALKQLCDSLGAGSEAVVAFGDMPNDLPMLTWAGHSVAVANAHPDVVRAAGELTESNDEEGVAQVLERIFAGVSGVIC